MPTEAETGDTEARPSPVPALNTLDNIHNRFDRWTADRWNGFAVETTGSNAKEKTGRAVTLTIPRRRGG